MTDPNPFTDSGRKRQFLAELRPVDDAGAERVIRVGTRAVTTEPGDSPPNARFLNVLEAGPILERELLDGDGSGEGSAELGGIARASAGALSIQLDGAGWDLADLHWAGWPAKVWMGAWGAPWTAHALIYDGFMGAPQVRGRMLVVPLFGSLRRLEKPFQDVVFAGTGSWEGGEDVKDRPKPALYGWGLNIEPQLVDGPNRSYVFHDGAAQAVDAGYSGGNAGAAYTADAANGRVTPTFAENGFPFTIDARGDSAGGFVDSHGRVLRRLIGRSSLSSAQIDEDAFEALHALNPARMGIWIPSEPRDLDEVIALVARSCGAAVHEDLAGRISVLRIDAPSPSATIDDADVALDERDLLGGRLELVRISEPVWRVPVHYAPNWRVMGRSEMAGAVHNTTREEFLKQAWRTTAAEDAAILDRYPEAPAAEPVDTLFIDEADAAAEAARRLAIRGVPRRTFACTAMTPPYAWRPGLKVWLTHSDFGLARGRLVIVRALKLRSGRDQAELRLWG